MTAERDCFCFGFYCMKIRGSITRHTEVMRALNNVWMGLKCRRVAARRVPLHCLREWANLHSHHCLTSCSMNIIFLFRAPRTSHRAPILFLAPNCDTWCHAKTVFYKQQFFHSLFHALFIPHTSAFIIRRWFTSFRSLIRQTRKSFFSPIILCVWKLTVVEGGRVFVREKKLLGKNCAVLKCRHQAIIMDIKRSYLAGDIHTLEKVNKIVPRKMELPLLMQSSWVRCRLIVMKNVSYFQFSTLFVSQESRSEGICLASNRAFSSTWSRMITNSNLWVNLWTYKVLFYRLCFALIRRTIEYSERCSRNHQICIIKPPF